MGDATTGSPCEVADFYRNKPAPLPRGEAPKGALNFARKLKQSKQTRGCGRQKAGCTRGATGFAKQPRKKAQ